MYKFSDYLKKQMIVEADAPPMGGSTAPPSGGGLGPPGLPTGGGMGLGGGMGAPPPMGGGGGLGPPMGGMGGMGAPPAGATPATKLKTTNVWDVLDHILDQGSI